MNKKLLGVLGVAALLLAGNFAWQEVKEVDAASTKTIYLKDNGYLTKAVDWVWSWKTGGSGVAYNLTDSDSDGILETQIPAENDWVIFVSGTSKGNWGKQTGDISIPTDYSAPLYTLNTDGSGMWSEFGQTIPTETYVEATLEKYVKGGRYIRETEIYIDAEKVAADLAENYDGRLYNSLFHAKATNLQRTTYFDNEELWMTNSDGTINSGYGTNENNEMNHFKYENGMKVIDYTVSGSLGMEDWYTTLKDIVVDETQGWEEENGVYKSTSNTVKEWFKDFTAPCYVGFETGAENYITFDHVEIEEKNSALELRLYASSGDETKLSSSDLLFSKATITLPNSNVAIAGGFNSWNSSYDLMPTDTKGVYYTEMKLSAASYEMKVLINDVWHGNDGTYAKLGEAWDFWGDNGSNCGLKITTEGKYSFTINTNGTYPKLTIKKVY